MKRPYVIGLLWVGCWYVGTLFAQTEAKLRVAERVYAYALSQFSQPIPDERSDSTALANFLKVTSLVKPEPASARLLTNSYLYAGIINQDDNRQPEALRLYQRSIQIGNRFRLPDTLLFKPYLYAGTAHYYLHAFDSSTYYYEKAEQIYLRNPHLPEAQRLYNSFGVLYYEAGNYQQSINYFQKALQLNEQQKGGRKNDFFVRYTSNIASALLHLEQYESAANLYKKLLPLHNNRAELLINLGITYVGKKDPQQALYYLKQIGPIEERYQILYENTLARAYIQLQEYGRATQILTRAMQKYERQLTQNQASPKNKNLGLSYKLLGDVAAEQAQYTKAVKLYQQAIIQLDYDFNDLKPQANPTHFNGDFTSFLLFESLAAKAASLEKIARLSGDVPAMEMAVGTYRSALNLANYIEKSFDTEQSRLFVVNKGYPVLQRAVTLLVYAYDRTNNPKYLEKAFRRCEQGKAAVLYIGQKENESKANTGIPDSLLQQERNLRFAISHLFMRLDRSSTQGEVAQIRGQIRDKEVELSRLADRLHDYPDYYQKKFGTDSINVQLLRQKVLKRRRAIVSYFQTDQMTYTFLLTDDQLRLFRTPNDSVFRHHLRGLIGTLKQVVPGEKYPGVTSSRYLYDRLIKPLEKELKGVRSLIVIPHGDLTQLSFDVLENAQQQYLVEQFDITYQYSTAFLRVESIPQLEDGLVLSVAPFNHSTNLGGFEPLPASGQEVSSLEGIKLLNTEATKSRFLELAKEASVIHLATHAVANDGQPSRSFIAFTPQSADNRLYAHELQFGVFDRAKLIFLSACETASGQLIDGEGVMSLSRALSYAGCPNLITSLWKAEDRATAYISMKFYCHLREGNSIARSLQLAKLDLLHDGRYAQFHSPQYWSHLVFIGSPSEPEAPFNARTIGLLAIALLVMGGGAWRLMKQKKVTAIAQ
ncbi:CHAT domain-containing protein [Rudanella lutea]|uniref:CHAT domain-containing protein n=1 Tax=Rudanella lutea TaxID=451374 RepID=UPI00069340DB|nr:CHAT domain-containing tetratricopeptide repeat protein [Rudanella lutea]